MNPKEVFDDISIVIINIIMIWSELNHPGKDAFVGIRMRYFAPDIYKNWKIREIYRDLYIGFNISTWRQYIRILYKGIRRFPFCRQIFGGGKYGYSEYG